MPKRLIDRQTALLEYLTSPAAIFPDAGASAPHAALKGIDPALLQLEARFSHEKRMAKIAAVLPRTFDLLGHELDRLVPAFVEACPPVDIDRMVNARQFIAFMDRHWREHAPKPAHLPDVMACEHAIAQARTEATIEAAGTDRPTRGGRRRRGPAIRRRPGVVLVRTAYDVRALFEGTYEGQRPVKRATALAISLTPDGLRIVELAPPVLELLAALDRWKSAGGLPGMDGLAAELAAAGLLELRA